MKELTANCAAVVFVEGLATRKPDAVARVWNVPRAAVSVPAWCQWPDVEGLLAIAELDEAGRVSSLRVPG